MHRLLTAVLLLLLVTAACGQGEDAAAPGDGDVTLPEDADAGDEGTAPAPEQEPVDGTLTGTLGGDAELEGGCAWIEVDGTRYEVMYPAGYEVGTDPVELRGPDGEVIAEDGDEVTVVGSVQEDQMSFGQIGPIFAATDVGG
jgi:hypothetical protein